MVTPCKVSSLIFLSMTICTSISIWLSCHQSLSVKYIVYQIDILIKDLHQLSTCMHQDKLAVRSLKHVKGKTLTFIALQVTHRRLQISLLGALLTCFSIFGGGRILVIGSNSAAVIVSLCLWCNHLIDPILATSWIFFWNGYLDSLYC